VTNTLARHDIDAIRRVFAMDEIVETVPRAFIAHARGEIVRAQPAQLLFDQPRGDCHIKYGAERGGATFVVKIATGFYDNPREGLPINDRIVIFFNAKTGQPLAIFQDQGWLTSWRTAAAGALAILAGAPKRVRRLGILGTGHQAELQAIWASRALGKVPVTVWGRSASKAENLCARLSDQAVSCSVAYDIGTLLRDRNVVARPRDRTALEQDVWVEVPRPPYGIEELQTLATVYEHYSRYGLGGNSVSLSAALQREPRSLRAYIRECANSPATQRARDA
jgi:ornithine cyclodeaminase/alanine dehydrogenase-like protein (mu-crystallin family)